MFQGQSNLEPINCSSVCADSAGLHELNNKGGKAISIPWGEIVSVQLGFGFRSERPAIQSIVAVGLVLVGAYAGLLPLIKYLGGFGKDTGPYGPASGVKLILGMAAFIPIGLYLLYSMLQRRYCLRISKNGSTRKLFFQDPALTYQEASFFLERLKELPQSGNITIRKSADGEYSSGSR